MIVTWIFGCEATEELFNLLLSRRIYYCLGDLRMNDILKLNHLLTVVSSKEICGHDYVYGP